MTQLNLNKSVQANGSELKSTQLKKHLVAELADGRMRPGEALPSEVRLAEQFEVSRPTVRRALSEMEQEGLIRRERGRGTFVNDDALKRFSRMNPFYGGRGDSSGEAAEFTGAEFRAGISTFDHYLVDVAF